jgi:hypothetical protein
MNKYDLVKQFIQLLTDKDNLVYLNSWKLAPYGVTVDDNSEYLWLSCRKNSPYGDFQMFVGWEFYKYLTDIEYDEQVKLSDFQPHTVENNIYFDGCFHTAMCWKFDKPEVEEK